jgi:alpha-tubulin suppressor-like RCC1 family protein
MKKNHFRFLALLLLALLTGCGGGEGAGGTTTTSSTSATTPTTTGPTLLSIVVTPINPVIGIGTSLQFTVTGTYSDGTTSAPKTGVTWSSSSSSVDTLFTTGLVTGKTAGVATITATVGTVNGSTQLTVNGPYIAVSAGGTHTVALKSDATLFAWGSNRWGQLGDGTTTDKLVPTLSGTALTWSSVSAGEFHTAAIRPDGTLWAWGFNQNGQLGDGSFDAKLAPTKIGDAATWVAASAGAAHTVALRKDGTLWAWGRNFSGQLGDGSTIDRPVPTAVPIPLGKPTTTTWTAVSAGATHTCGRLSDGTIACWGSNTNGQLGDGTTTQRLLPTAVSGFSAVSVSAGGYHTLAIQADGALFSWGANDKGQLGHSPILAAVNTPTRVGLLTNWAIVSAGGNHSLAINSDRSLYAWGSNSNGQLGDGTTTDRPAPTQITVPSITPPAVVHWLSIAGGKSHTATIRDDGTLWTWGLNANGQLGDGSFVDRSVPTLLP